MASIRKRNGKWQVQVRREGQPTLAKTFGFKSDAEHWARHKEREADQGHLINHRHCLRSHTLADLVVRYRDTISVDKKGRKIETIVLNAFLRHEICAIRLSELTTGHFAAYRDERLQEIKPASLKRQLDPISNMFEVARDEWGIPIRENPLAKLRLPSINNRRERRLKDGELERLIEAARTRKNPLIAPIIQFAVETGMRRGEILAMCWDHIDWKQRSLLIPEAKNGYARTIPLTPKGLEILKELGSLGKGISTGNVPCVDTNASVFPITANAFRLSWGRVKRRAEIDDLHFHDLRHEAISRFFEMGLNAPEVALISGHRDMRMLFRYTHPMRSTINEKFDKEGLRQGV